ncbi:MAG: sec-independent protein translocase protein TatC [Solirubrobacteraceae bacterium]|jgi:sec-independent protein translocase protein TatC|nr:sec-independent protein translocase protein TatC [Solirubrobacteraceae bacterium]
MATTLRPVSHEDRLSLVEHLDELRSRLIVCVAAFVVALGVCLWQSHAVLDILNHPLQSTTGHNRSDPTVRQADYDAQIARALALIAPVLRESAASARTPQQRATASKAAAAASAAARAVPPVEARRPVTLGVSEPFTATFKVAAYAALILILPILLYQAYAFVLPAFSPSERSVALPLMLLVPFLFIAGVCFAYFLALPAAINFLQNFNSDQFQILIQARDLYGFSVTFMGAMGLLFQLPVGILAVVRMGIVSVAQLRHVRRYAIVVCAIVAAALPGVDPVSMILEMIPLVVLYEGSILLAALTERRHPRHAGSFAGLADADDDAEHLSNPDDE